MLRRLAIEDPGKLAQIAYGLLPRDVFISVEADAGQNASGAELGPVLETIETALRARPGQTDRGGLSGAAVGATNDDPVPAATAG